MALIEYNTNKDDIEEIKDTLKALREDFISVREMVGRHERDRARLIDLEWKTADNMKRLNEMMNEMKGIIAQVRGRAAKNDWYGQEMKTDPLPGVREINGRQEIRTSQGITFKEVGDA